MAKLVNTTKYLKKVYHQSFPNSPKNWRGGDTSQIILRGQNYPDCKTTQKHDKKRKLQVNIPYEYRYQNLQQKLVNQIQEPLKRTISHDQVVFASGMLIP